MKTFVVVNEKGAQFGTPAKDREEAIERYWSMIDSCVSCIEKRCTCYNKERVPMDRSKYARPIKVVESSEFVKFPIGVE